MKYQLERLYKKTPGSFNSHLSPFLLLFFFWKAMYHFNALNAEEHGAFRRLSPLLSQGF